MRILVSDFYPKKAHKYLNLKLIRALSEYADVTVVSINGLYEEERASFMQSNIEVVDFNVNERTGRLGTRLWCIAIQKKFKKLLKTSKSKYDLSVCMSYDTIALGVGAKLTKSIPLVLCQHSNIDEFSNHIKFKFAKRYLYQTTHIVFEEAFKDYLSKQFNIDKGKIFYVPSPITLDATPTTDQPTESFDCIGLCNANSDEMIQNIVDNCQFYQENNISLVFRSKTVKSNCENIRIISGYLEREEYIRYIKQANCIFVATPPQYNYRLSGSVYDAFALHKKVLTTNQFYAENYKNKYPGICFFVKNEKEFGTAILNFRSEQTGADQVFDTFISDHSITATYEKIHEMLKELENQI